MDRAPTSRASTHARGRVEYRESASTQYRKLKRKQLHVFKVKTIDLDRKEALTFVTQSSGETELAPAVEVAITFLTNTVVLAPHLRTLPHVCNNFENK